MLVSECGWVGVSVGVRVFECDWVSVGGKPGGYVLVHEGKRGEEQGECGSQGEFRGGDVSE